jgi:hypothetical protein
MNTTKAHRVIAASAVITFGIGFANSVFKNKKLPEMRFFIGLGVLYLALSALAEKEPEIANAFGIAVATTAVLGQGDGILTYLQGHPGELDTRKPTTANAPRRTPTAAQGTAAPRAKPSAVVPPTNDSGMAQMPGMIQPPAGAKHGKHHG